MDYKYCKGYCQIIELSTSIPLNTDDLAKYQRTLTFAYCFRGNLVIIYKHLKVHYVDAVRQAPIFPMSLIPHLLSFFCPKNKLQDKNLFIYNTGTKEDIKN